MIDQKMDNNVPNLNVEELAAYATAKSRAGVSDEEILQEITQMLREDGWKEAAIGPTIEAIVKRSAIIGGKGSPRQGSPPKANRDSVAVMMAQMMEMLSPIANRLEALERKQGDRRSDASPALATPPPPEAAETPQAAARRNKYPHPELFDGDRTRYPSFRYKAKAKLRNDYVGASDTARIDYIVSRCTDKASDVLLPWAERNQPHGSVEDLWTFLDQQYDDPHLKLKALDQLSNLRQGKRSVRDYHMEFNRLELQSGERFGCASKKSMFVKGLLPKLQEALANIDDDVSFEELVHKAVRTADNLYRAGLAARASRSTQPYAREVPTHTQTAPRGEEMDWEPTRANKADTRRKRPKGSTLTCYACGKEGHFIRECPEVVKVRKARLAQDEERSECSDGTSGKE
jgi:hypothetical protein